MMTDPQAVPRDSRRVPLETQVQLSFERFTGFIREYSSNISPGGMFIRTRTPRPAGSLLQLEFRLGDGYELISGRGEVVWVRTTDESPERRAGMGIRFLELSPGSLGLIYRMVDEHILQGGTPFDISLVPPSPPAAPAPPPPAAAPAPPVTVTPAAPPAPAPGVSSSPAAPRPAAPAAEASGLGKPARSAAASPAAAISAEEDANPFAPLMPPSPGPPRVRLVPAAAREPQPSAAVPARTPAPSEPARIPAPSEPAPAPWPVLAAPTSPPASPSTAIPLERPAAAAVPSGPARRPVVRWRTLRWGGLAFLLAIAALAYLNQEQLLQWVLHRQEASAPPPLPVPGGPPPKPLRAAAAVAGEPGAPGAAAPGTTPAAGEAATAPAVPAVPAATVLERISWEPLGGGTEMVLWGNGAFGRQSYVHMRIEGEPPRELIRLTGIDRPFTERLTVGTAQVRQVRTGFHPGASGSELHVVLDLTGPGVEITGIDLEERRLRIHLQGG